MAVVKLLKGAEGGVCGLPQKKIGFAMDNGESKMSTLKSDRGYGSPDPPPESATGKCSGLMVQALSMSPGSLLSPCLFPPWSKWVPANFQGNLTKMLWGYLPDGLVFHPGE